MSILEGIILTLISVAVMLFTIYSTKKIGIYDRRTSIYDRKTKV